MSHEHPITSAQTLAQGHVIQRCELCGRDCSSDTGIPAFALRVCDCQNCDVKSKTWDGLAFLWKELQQRYERTKNPDDLQYSTAVVQILSGMTPRSQLLAKLEVLAYVGVTLLLRYERFDDWDDLSTAVAVMIRVLELAPGNHTWKILVLHYFGRARLARYNKLRSIDDLEEATAVLNMALIGLPDTHPQKLSFMLYFGLAVLGGFERRGAVEDLNTAIAIFSRTVLLTPDGHPLAPLFLHHLGVSRHARYERLGALDDLDAAVAHQDRAVELTPAHDAQKPKRLLYLGISRHARFERLGNFDDLEAAIISKSQAVELSLDSDPEKPPRLSSLGDTKLLRFHVLGSLEDLESVIAIHSRAIELTVDGDPERPSRLDDLGRAKHARFGRLGDFQDLEAAIEALSQAVKFTDDKNKFKAAYLNNLASSKRAQYEHLGNLDDLEETITLQGQAVELTPDWNTDKAGFLHNLAISQDLRFRRTGILADSELALSTLTRAIQLTPDGHPLKAARFNTLGNLYNTLFERLGRLEDLQRAIEMLSQAVKLAPNGHPHTPGRLSNLGLAQKARFQRLGTLDDLEASIVSMSRAVELTPRGHPDIPGLLSNLGVAQEARFYRLGTVEDLEVAITNLTRAVSLVHDGHLDKPGVIVNLGGAQKARFDCLGTLEDLEAAIETFRRAIELAPAEHPQKPLWLSNLGVTQQARFKNNSNPDDLEAAIAAKQMAVEMIPEGHALRATLLHRLGHGLNARLCSPYKTADDPVDVIRVFMSALTDKSGDPTIKLEAGKTLIQLFPRMTPSPSAEFVLQVHQHIIDLVPQIVWLGHDVNRRYQELFSLGSLSNQAAAAAIAAGEYSRAIEWLESGRSIVWSQVLRLRTPLDDLRQRHPETASRLDQVTRGLREGVPESIDADHSFGSVKTGPDSLDEQAKSHYGFAIQYDKLIQEIRGLEGFEHFLQPRSFSELKAVSSVGYVVVVNVHESRCDALILRDTNDVIHVPLPSFSYNQAKDLQTRLRTVLKNHRLLGRTRDIYVDEDHHGRGGRTRPPNEGDELKKILAELWSGVVKPVIDEINKLPGDTTTTLPHITWCPTGPLVFLPLHAAGIYRDEGKGTSKTAMDVAVSSYAPTLESLLKPRVSLVHSTSTDSTTSPKILVVAQPDTPGASPIPNTKVEADLVQGIFPECTTILNDDQATVAAVLEEMASHDWVHLACHGIQNSQDPTQSAFALHDGLLKLSTLMNKELPKAQLAVLSACQTATGDEKLSEEAVHLAAAMLNAGFRSVVGTLWSISDRTAPKVAKIFYEALSRQVEAGEELQPAYALHEAIQRLRQPDDMLRWVPFVHFGL
ncbi:TPR-like protein [Irpex rosettiformis]|uniref:TPR-like protein n=1 Tax=Irpex rosettiformis TaxID=378272 RepID=A0ACB8U324_9APHY|nr:TPR-like protein [Irpex rosettiformis]